MSDEIDWAALEEATKNGMIKRETAATGPPACVSTCMRMGVITGCASDKDLRCLCRSVPYQTSVLTCWNLRCSIEEYTQGIAFITTSCAALTVFIDPAAIVKNISGPSSKDINTPPVLFSKAAFNIQAVMSSLCSLVLAIALILGFISCRNHARREAQMSQRTAQYSNDKTARSRSYFGAAPSRPTISTMDMEGSVDFGDMFTGPPGARRSVQRFTNRLPTTEEEGPEKWEMINTNGSGSGSDTGKEGREGQDVRMPRRDSTASAFQPETPATTTTFTVNHDEFDSTAHLAPAPQVATPTPSYQTSDGNSMASPRSPPPAYPSPSVPLPSPATEDTTANTNPYSRV